jgi:hypothetical protein
MFTIAMTGEKQISLSSLWAERLKKVHKPHCPGMTADNIKTIR